MGALTNIYCIPRAPGAVGWARVMTTLADQALVRAPFRAGAPFGDEERSTICWPENWLVPQTLRPSSLELPLRDEILWIHGKCVPPEEEFLGSPIHRALQELWPAHLVLDDAFP